VLYRRKGEDSSLYSLVTDYVFLNEPSVVWERFEDVDGGNSTFFDSDFFKASPAGGDVAGHTSESALAALEGSLTAQDDQAE
jgi:ubiquitin carboxyl-terminal hydrolase MINDY-1/2